MSFIRATSYAHNSNRTITVMLWVILATLPGFFALSYFFGWGSSINLLLAIVTCLTCEALILYWRQRLLSFI